MVDRPTFSENWHRVAELRPRLRAAVRVFRQKFRGRMWHVLSDPANNQHYRLDEAGYHFIGLLDGRRTVAEAWEATNEAFGDEAPTQGEAIRLLGQLYTSNLLHAELPPDAEQMFDRYRKRVRREVGGQLMNFLFVRIPLFDPNRILQAWVPAVGWLFGPVGLLLWLALLIAAGVSLTGRFGELWASADPQALLATDNLILLYACFVVTKAIHEFGHGFACAHFGRKSGVGGPVHTIGIMLLVLMPVPYVDASSSWVFRNRWHRMFVAAAGMYVELAVAAAAAIVWANTGESTLAHALAYNVIFIAGVSTLLFNANPLLRFDGYYILSDLLNTANLAQRSRQFLYYLVRRYVYGVRKAPNPAHTGGEKPWLLTYAIASGIYRVIICIGILLYIADVLFIVGVLMAFAAIVMWVVVPIGKVIKYLALSPELVRVRWRAIGSTVAVVGGVVGFLGAYPMPDRGRAEGVVEPVRMAEIHLETDGFVRATLPSGQHVSPDGPPLIELENNELRAEKKRLEADIKAVRIRREAARREDPAVVQALQERLAALQERLAQVERELAALTIHAPFEGIWFSPDSAKLEGVHLSRGERIGMVADPDELIVRAVADQQLGPRIEPEVMREGGGQVELRVKGRPGIHLTGNVRRVLDAGQRDLPSAALGYVAGGTMRVSYEDQSGRRAAEPFFEIHVEPESEATAGDTQADRLPLRTGQRVVVRFTMGRAPLLAQWYRDVRQMIQRRFSLSG